MDYKVSVDMVRLQVRHYVKDCKFGIGVETILSAFKCNNYVDYREMRSIKAYRHNFYINDFIGDGQTCSFWLGVEHNSVKREVGEFAKVDVVLEYNPNKCNGSVILEYLMANVFRNNKTIVKSIDVAIDLDINILDIKPVRRGNRSYKLFDYGGDNITHYIGERSTDGAIKIYNKAREMKMKDVNWTRYEITLKPNISIQNISSGCWSIDEKKLIDLTLFINPALDVGGTDRVLILSCMEHPEYLKMLGRDKRKKIEQFLAENCSIIFDTKLIESTVCNFFKKL